MSENTDTRKENAMTTALSIRPAILTDPAALEAAADHLKAAAADHRLGDDPQQAAGLTGRYTGHSPRAGMVVAYTCTENAGRAAKWLG